MADRSPSRRSGSLIARSISGRVWESLEQSPVEGRVLAVFERACLLLFPEDRVVALVQPEIGNGPLNIVLESPGPFPRGGQAGVFASLEPGMEAELGSGRLHVGEMEVRPGGADVWEPRADWDRLRRKRGDIEGRLPWVQAMALDQVPEGSLLGLWSRGDSGRRAVKSRDLTGRTGVRRKPVRSGLAAIWEGLGYLEAGWEGNRTALQAGSKLLAGLGGGLTPAGDDFLTGVMLWAWLAHPEPQGFCRGLLEASAARTTMLSAAFLRCAAAGECSAAWHDLLAALDGGPELQLAEAVTSVLSFGHSSGADALAGFVWRGLVSSQGESAQVASEP